MKVYIKIHHPIENSVDDWDEWVDAFDLLGATLDDFNSETQVALLQVEASEIDREYRMQGGIYPHEVGGAIHMVEEYAPDVKVCKWRNFPIINAEQVCSAIEGLDYVG